MKIVETVFDCCFVMEPFLREDNRGAFWFWSEGAENIQDPKEAYFFGIHDQSVDNPQGKLIGVIQGRGLDYIVDLRSESATFGQYKCLELDGNIPDWYTLLRASDTGFLRWRTIPYWPSRWTRNSGMSVPGLSATRTWKSGCLYRWKMWSFRIMMQMLAISTIVWYHLNNKLFTINNSWRLL